MTENTTPAQPAPESLASQPTPEMVDAGCALLPGVDAPTLAAAWAAMQALAPRATPDQPLVADLVGALRLALDALSRVGGALPQVPQGPADEAVDAFLAEIRAELVRARAKFPGGRIMGLALAEEFGELVKAMLDEPAAAVRKEAVQTAVMAARVALDGDSSVTGWRAERGLDPLPSCWRSA